MKNFVSVSTNAARIQDISLNPQKLAGMCAKLKCCLNYEVDDYMEASRRLPSKEMILQTQDADYYYFKADILTGVVTYSTDKNIAANLVDITAERAREVIELNKKGEKPLSLKEDGEEIEEKKSTDLLADADVSRFDKAKRNKKKKSKQKGQETPANRQAPKAEQPAGQQKPAPNNNPQKPNAQKAGPAPANDPKANQTSDNAQGTDDRGARGNQRRGNNRKPRRQQPKNDRAPRQQNNPDNNRRQNDQPQ